MSTIGKDIGLGCGRAAVIQLIGVAVGLPLALALVGVSLWLATTFYDRPLIIVLGASLALALFLVTLLAFMIIVVLRRRAQLDAVFEPLGLEGEVYQTFFRQYYAVAVIVAILVFLFVA